MTTDDESRVDDPLSPYVENPIELDQYSLSTAIYAERDDGKILLLQRAEGSAMAGSFFLPGGIVDPGEEPFKAAAREQLPVVHPENPGIEGITIIVVSGPPTAPGAHAKNAVVVSSGELDWDRPATWTGAIDRSPCGTGTCAKMAVLHAKGKLALNEDFLHEGILGTVFTGRLIRETEVGDYPAVVPTLSGQAWITGFASYVLDPEDPFPEGFTVGDIWGGAMA